MTHNAWVGRVMASETALERIKHLEQQLAAATVNSRQRRWLNSAIQMEADVYRKSLDTEQATASHDANPPPAEWRVLLESASRKPALARRIPSRHRFAPRR